MEDLPIEVLVHIFQQLDPFTIAKYRRVCRSFNNVLTAVLAAHPFSNLVGLVHIGHTSRLLDVFCFVTPAAFGEDFLTKVQKRAVDAYTDATFEPYPVHTLNTLPINPLTATSEDSLFDSLPSEFANLFISSCLVGPLPSTIGSLKELTCLDLQDDHMHGPIPPSLGELRKLTTLNLERNAMIGPIPSELGNLINLTNLNLSVTHVDGAIPDSLGNLVNLDVLNLSSARLSGPIPASLANLVNLVELRLGKNLLSCTVPDVFGGMNKLRILNLCENQLEGPIPPSIGLCMQLSKL
ncbi:hypothetical protein HDU81_001847, partial [Chytriomyces hyalinus]